MALTLITYEKKIEEYENNKHKVTVTMYHPVSGQTDDTPNITADGSVIRINNASEYRYIAVSRNMLIRNKGFLILEIISGWMQVRNLEFIKYEM